MWRSLSSVAVRSKVLQFLSIAVFWCCIVWQFFEANFQACRDTCFISSDTHTHTQKNTHKARERERVRERERLSFCCFGKALPSFKKNYLPMSEHFKKNILFLTIVLDADFALDELTIRERERAKAKEGRGRFFLFFESCQRLKKN